MGVIQKTSIDAYQLLQRKGRLSRIEANALRLIGEQPGHTSREYTQLYFERYPYDKALATTIQPRISDLHKKGYVAPVGTEPFGTKKCTVTGVQASAWGIPKQIQLELEGMKNDGA